MMMGGDCFMERFTANYQDGMIVSVHDKNNTNNSLINITDMITFLNDYDTKCTDLKNELDYLNEKYDELLDKNKVLCDILKGVIQEIEVDSNEPYCEVKVSVPPHMYDFFRELILK